jgi:putative two-component system response regulator
MYFKERISERMREAKKTILAIDDMSLNLRTIKLTLEKYYDVRVAKSGEQALSVLGTGKVDLILLDIEMPGMSGFETLELIKLQPNGEKVPVIFVTSHVSTELIAKALKKGAKDYIMKPFEPDVLIRKVYAVLNGVSDKNVQLTWDGRCRILPSELHSPTDKGVI